VGMQAHVDGRRGAQGSARATWARGRVAGGALADWQGGRQTGEQAGERTSEQPTKRTGAGGSRQFWGRMGKRQLRAGVQSALCATGTSYDGVVVVGSRWRWDRMQP
jgi:hypothetical protein